MNLLESIQNANNKEMHILKATRADIEDLCFLVNSAYRGDSGRKGWTTEADFLDGQRIDYNSLANNFAAKSVLIFKALIDNKIVGCVCLEQKKDFYYLGMLTCHPLFQKRGIGAKLLSYCENFAQENKIYKIKMKVISIRSELIQWYQAKSYLITPLKEKFPYGDERFGIPKRQDLEFLVLEKNL